jgi:hypothetical protein
LPAASSNQASADKIAAEVQRFGGHLTKVQKAAVVDWIDSVIDK